MKFLFFFVHPSKFHLFRNTINQLLANGHQVDILITTKDILEDLVIEEGWEYYNIFPEGRKIKGLHPKISAILNLLRTLWRLNKYLSKRTYNLFITDDLLTIIGKLKKIPSVLFQDDDLNAVPESVLLLATANHILTPKCTNFYRYNYKKISVPAYKQSAYLHPNYFKPDINVLKKYNLVSQKFFIIRIVYLGSTHDAGKKGIDNMKLRKLILTLQKYGKVIINSERVLDNDLESLRMNTDKKEFIHLLAFADLFISDSQTMSAESAFVGTPFIRYNDFVGKISYLKELEENYELGFGFPTNSFDQALDKAKELVNASDIKINWLKRVNKLFDETIDLSKFMIWLFENYPVSVTLYNKQQIEMNNFK